MSRKVAREFETTAGRPITGRKFNREHCTICDLKSNIHQIADVEISRRDVGGDLVTELKCLFMTDVMDN